MPPLPPAVRILPMSTRTPGFQNRSIADVQHRTFLNDLPAKGGHFHYPSTGLQSPRGSAVLFQFQAHIIACAILLKDEKFLATKRGFAGVLHFDPASFQVFAALDAPTMRTLWPQFRNFGHVKQVLNPQRYPAFLRHIRAHPATLSD